MNAALTKTFDSWNSLNFTQKTVLGTLFIATILTTFFFYTRSQQDYDVMFSGLSEPDAAAIVHNLRQRGVNYKLADKGTTILVPRKKKEDLRLDAFQEDLIKSDQTLGFGALEGLPFGLTEWQERKYDQKIISDEVSTTLERLAGIRKAKVIVAKANDSLFSSEQEESKASVLLVTDPGFRLKAEQVKTIKAIVSHAVPGLDPANVTIADAYGNTLSDDLMSSNGGTGSSEADRIRSSFEQQKAKAIMDMLSPVVGPQNAVVKVSAEMNFDRQESHIKRFLPSGGTAENPTGIPVSIQSNVEAYNGDGKNKGNVAGGEPGVTSNVPNHVTEGGFSEGDKGKENQYENKQNITNYELSSEEKTIIHAPGTVQRMSVAVVVNKILTDSQVDEIRGLVASASGIDTARGDTLTVSGLQFSPEVQEEQKQSLDVLKQSNKNELIIKLAQLGGIFVLAIVALLVFYNLLQRPAEGELMEEEEEPYLLPPEQFEEAPNLVSSENIPILEARLEPEIEQMREAIHGMVNRDPSEAARILVTFMKDL